MKNLILTISIGNRPWSDLSIDSMQKYAKRIDAHLKVIRKYNVHKKFNFKIVNNKRNMGVAFSRNIGLNLAKGDYIAFCDDDDAWYPNKLERQMKEIKKYRSGMCCTEARGGKGLFDKNKNYNLYNGKIYKRFNNKKFKDEFKNGTPPKFWNKELELVEIKAERGKILLESRFHSKSIVIPIEEKVYIKDINIKNNLITLFADSSVSF